MTIKSITLSSAALALFAALSVSSTVTAGEDDGRLTRRNLRHASCSDLYVIRNGIYDRAGYCFKTERALDEFSNRGCRFTNISSVPLSGLDHANIQLVRTIEREKYCN